MNALPLVIAILVAASLAPGASITYVRGPIRIERGNQVAVAASSGAKVDIGDRIAVGPSAAVALRVNGATLRTEGAGELALLRTDQVQWGGDFATVVAGEQALQIIGPHGMVQLRDATARLRKSGSGMFVESLDGTAGVFGKLGYVAVPAGSGVRLDGSETALKPAKLPVTPKPIHPAPFDALRAFRFHWRAIADAAAYRFELAADPSFSEPLFTREVTSPAIVEPSQSVPIGLLYWRVSAIGNDGYESAPSLPQSVRIAP